MIIVSEKQTHLETEKRVTMNNDIKSSSLKTLSFIVCWGDITCHLKWIMPANNLGKECIFQQGWIY